MMSVGSDGSKPSNRFLKGSPKGSPNGSSSKPSEYSLLSMGQKGERGLELHWSDGRRDVLDVVLLRRRCPCASCIDEWTRKPLIDPDQIPESVRPRSIETLGRYALKITFSDGHRTGIYSFDMLRQLADVERLKYQVGEPS